jgi:hydrogenase-4 component E
MKEITLLGILISTYFMIIAKRIPALISAFRYQSFFLFLITLIIALGENQSDLYIVCGLLFILKVSFIPNLLYRIVNKLKVGQDLGLIVNSQVSLLFALGLTYLAWIFSVHFFSFISLSMVKISTVVFFIFLSGLFLMIFRMTALAQIIGLLVMENGLFLFASTVSGGMPFFVEIAIFFDVFVSVVIMGFFVYRMNKLFTHIDVNKLSHLKG